MKRVLIFSLEYLPRVGGAEIALKELTDRLSDEFDFDLIAWGEGPVQERIGAVTVYRVPGAKALYPVRASLKGLRLNKSRPFDLVWGMMAAYAGFAALFFKLRKPKTPFLLTLQEGDPIPHIQRRARFVYPLFRMIFTRADAIQAISTYLADFGKSMGHQGLIDVIPNGVDTDRFVRKQSPIDLKHVVLVTTSRLVKKNGIDTIIRALVLLPDSAIFRVYGEGPEEASLRALAQSLGVEDRVEWKGFLAHEEVPVALLDADIFVRPSRSEGMGNSFIEAMAAGLPVIATQAGGIKDFLYDAERNPDRVATGFVVDVDAPEQIAEKVTVILSDSVLVKRVTDEAHRMVLQSYGWDHIARAMRGVLERVSKGARMGV